MSEDKSATPNAPAMVQSDPKQALIKLVLELGPLVLFFLCTTLGEGWLDKSELLRTWFSSPIILATAVFMPAMAISLLVSWLIFKRVAVMPLITLGLVIIFGGLTLYFQESIFIKIKPTILNILFGTILLGGLAFKQSLLRYVFGETYSLTPTGWKVLTVRWGIFFFFLAALNEVAWRSAEIFFSDPDAGDKFYAGFKLWGTLPITLIFSMFQLPALTRYADHGSAETAEGADGQA